MHYKTNRQNHDFQILHFIVGACHTPDGAYAILCDLEEDRDNALKHHAASKIREKATRLAIQEKIRSARNGLFTTRARRRQNEISQCEATAELAEIEATQETTRRCYDAALAELAFIRLLKTKLEPHRRFQELSLPEAHQAAQHQEWKFELMKRAENYLLSGNGIPADHFGTMRMHPDWETVIQPHIKNILAASEQARLGKANVQVPLLTTPLTEVKLNVLLLDHPSNTL